MSKDTRVFKSGKCEITQNYKSGIHNGIDLTDKNHTFGWLTAHSDGEVVKVVNNFTGFKTGSYGNYVKIKHNNGYYTLYAHGKKGSVKVKIGDKIKKGTVLMYMGNTGESYGAHLHFEVRDKSDKKINPTNYLNADLPSEIKKEEKTIKYKIGDKVIINGVYVSSTSTKKLVPLINKGTITRIVEGTHNPYLLNDGAIGWVNDGVIKEIVK